MSIIDSLVYDRTDADVHRWTLLNAKSLSDMTADEKAMWLAGMKGSYNASDLNRVESAMGYLSGMLQQLPITLEQYRDLYKVAASNIFDVPYEVSDIIITTKTNWAITDIPTPADMSRYTSNLKKLCNALEFQHPALPSSMSNLTYGNANAIESALRKLYDAILEFEEHIKSLIGKAHMGAFYSGDLYGGEV